MGDFKGEVSKTLAPPAPPPPPILVPAEAPPATTKYSTTLSAEQTAAVQTTKLPGRQPLMLQLQKYRHQ